MEQQRNDNGQSIGQHRNEPAFKEDAPFLSRMSVQNWKSLTRAAVIGGSIVAAYLIMQFRIDSQDRQMARQDRMFEQLGQRLERKEAEDDRQDSNLIEINAERRRESMRPERARRETYAGAPRTPHALRDHTAVAVLSWPWANFPIPPSVGGPGWKSTTRDQPRGRDTIIRGDD